MPSKQLQGFATLLLTSKDNKGDQITLVDMDEC